MCQSELELVRLIPLMVKAQGTPFAVPPATMATMCKHLYQVGRPEDNDDGGDVLPATLATVCNIQAPIIGHHEEIS